MRANHNIADRKLPRPGFLWCNLPQFDRLLLGLHSRFHYTAIFLPQDPTLLLVLYLSLMKNLEVLAK